MTDLLRPPAPDLAPETLAPKISAFLGAHWGDPVRVSRFKRFPAGMSWVTIGFVAESNGRAPQSLILRIGDPAGLLAPYRAEPEYLALTALAGMDDLPIPKAIAFSDDAAVIGAPFLITERVDGTTPMPWKGDAQSRSAAHNESLGRDFARALGAIHGFDWRSTGLARLWEGVDAGVALREVRHWSRHASLLGDHGARNSSPQMHYAMRWLESRAPVAEHVTIVHGDYRVGNFLERDGRITAILDWELMHAGDPHEDIAWAGLRTFSAGTDRIGGLVPRDDFIAMYRERTGFVVRPEVVRYYEVLVQFKMAAMLIGAVRRIESGEARDVRMAAMGFQLAPTLLELNRLIAEAT